MLVVEALDVIVADVVVPGAGDVVVGTVVVAEVVV